MTEHTDRTPDTTDTRPTVSETRAKSDLQHREFLLGIRRDILAADGDDKAHHQTRLIRALDHDVQALTEQRDRAEQDRDAARGEGHRTFEQLMTAWRGWTDSEGKRLALQRKVDRREWINWYAVVLIVGILAITVAQIAAYITGGA